MHAHVEQNSPKLAPPSTKSRELRKLIIKLRWIGMECEAQDLIHMLASVAPAETLMAGPLDTD